MNRLFIFLTVNVGICVSVWGNPVDGYVYSVRGTPLKNVEIQNKKTGDVVYSDTIGFFSIDGEDRDTVSFTLSTYTTNSLTIRNIKNSNGRIFLFKELFYELPEVVVIPDNKLYALYEKSVFNLKSRLIKNRAVSYQCTQFEKEINEGDEQALNIIFTAILDKINPKQNKINYKILLSKLQVSLGNQTSELLKDNSIYNRNLFLQYINNKLPVSKNYSMQISDSITVIKNEGNRSNIIYTIDNRDTTLIKIEYAAKPDLKYIQLRTFKAKQLYGSLSIEYRKDKEGYFMYERTDSSDDVCVVRKNEKEERIIRSSQITALPCSIKDASLKIDLDTRILYNMGNYPVGPD